jgi:hypothetical protein
MAALIDYSSRTRLRGELLESLIVEIRLANEDCRNAKDEMDLAIAANRLKNALQVFEDLLGQNRWYKARVTSCRSR